MVEVLFSPRWFYGVDAIFESIAIITTALLSLYAYKLYKFTKKLNHKYFSLSFLMLSLAFLAKVITNLILYFPELREKTVSFILKKYYILQQTNLVYAAGNLAYRFLMLLGLLGIFWIIGKSREKNKLLILFYFISLVSFISIFPVYVAGISVPIYYIYHITAALFLAYITYFYFENYKIKKKKAMFSIFSSFFLIFLSQLLFMFVVINLTVYVFAEFFQLVGFMILLYQYYILSRKK
jgi:hypothetical protein